MSTVAGVRLRKSAYVVGNTLVFRDAEIEDAAFILSLRVDNDKSRYLSSVSGELSEQVGWLERYSEDQSQAYFIIDYQGESIGTVRLYDAQCMSFCWGSWILKSSRPSHAAIESALMVYAYAVDHLGFHAAHFDVRKGNERVWQFHERFGARRTSETDIDYFYSIDRDAIDSSRLRYRRFLNNGVSVVFK